MKTLLVIECQGNLNWYPLFEGLKIHGEEIKVEQAEWDDISVISYFDSGAVVSLRRAKNPLKGTSQETERNTQIHFVLLRSVTRGIKGQDSRNKLFALMHSNVPSVNSLHSAYMCLERPLVFAQLKAIQKRLGKDNFPVIEQTLYPSFREMLITPEYPIVGKVGHAHAGYGKIKIKDSNEFHDFRSLCALHGDYVTVEPFIDWDWDGRVQKIGNNYRVFKRVSQNWKGNVGNMSVIEDIELTPKYKEWVDECAKVFGGLEICGLDFVHSRTDDKEYILELNDTAIGLVHDHADEDMAFIRDIVVLRMTQAFVPKEKAATEEEEEEGEGEEKKKDKGKDKGKEKQKKKKISKKEEIKQLKEQIQLLEIQLAREKAKQEAPSTSEDNKKTKKKSIIPFLN